MFNYFQSYRRSDKMHNVINLKYYLNKSRWFAPNNFFCRLEDIESVMRSKSHDKWKIHAVSLHLFTHFDVMRSSSYYDESHVPNKWFDLVLSAYFLLRCIDNKMNLWSESHHQYILLDNFLQLSSTLTNILDVATLIIVW